MTNRARLRRAFMLALLVAGTTSAEEAFKPLITSYERAIPYRGPSKDYAVSGASFMKIVHKIFKFSLNPHLAETGRLLIDTRSPRKEITRTLTDYSEVVLSPDRKVVGFVDYVETPLSYRFNVYDLASRKRSVVFEISEGQIDYFVWLQDSSAFVQFQRVSPGGSSSDRPGITVGPAFSWLSRTGTVIGARDVPLAIPLVDAPAIAFSADGKRYMRIERERGERPWFHCDRQTEFKTYGPSGTTVAVKGPTGDREDVRVPGDASTVAKAGWERLPRAIGCSPD